MGCLSAKQTGARYAMQRTATAVAVAGVEQGARMAERGVSMPVNVKGKGTCNVGNVGGGAKKKNKRK